MPRTARCRGRSASRRGWWVILLVAACTLGACGRRMPVVDESETRAQEALRAVAGAYNAAIAKRGKPPVGPDDIKPFLATGVSVDDALRSPRDGQPFVVVWGADPRQGMDAKPLVIAYEAQGQDGRRMVFTAMGVFAMSDAGFKDARFPEGHAPAAP